MDAIDKRKSVRTYAKQSLSSEQLKGIRALLDREYTGPMGTRLSFELIGAGQGGNSEAINTLGFITGEFGAIVGWTGEEPDALVDYGYVLESIVLQLVDRGFGTCWVGGTFSRKDVMRAMKEDRSDDLHIPAIVTVGEAVEGFNITNLLLSSKKKKRKDFDELFLGEDGQKIEDSEKIKILEGVRWSPSAMNSQPTRVIWQDDQVHFYCKEGGMNMHYLDVGIAMNHFFFRANQAGLKGEWTTIRHHPNAMDHYIATFIIKNE